MRLIAIINSHFSVEAIELVVSASLFNPALHPDEILLGAYGSSMPTTEANFNGEKVEATFEGVTYSSLPIIKRKIARKWQVFKRAVFHEKKVVMEKTPDSILQDVKDTMEKNMFVYFQNHLK